MLHSHPNAAAGDTSALDPPRYSEDIDSNCSTPFVSAPSSPGHAPSGYFFSAPASPMHFLLLNEKSKASSSTDYEPIFLSSDSGSFEFEFSSRFSPNGRSGKGSMTSADELFFNGQIRPMKLSSHLERPHDDIPPLMGLCGEEEDAANVRNDRGRDLRLRSNKYCHRKARSMSPLRFSHYELKSTAPNRENEVKENESNETTPSCSASSSRSSSSGRNSKKWIFLKDLLHRSKSEGRTNSKEKFWSAISFSPAKEKKTSSSPPVLSPSSSRDEKKGKTETKKEKKAAAARKPANGVWRRRAPLSAHELHYTANRAQAEEMKKKTFLPYRQGLLGCLGFSSKSYGAFSGFTRTLNPISSRWNHPTITVVSLLYSLFQWLFIYNIMSFLFFCFSFGVFSLAKASVYSKKLCFGITCSMIWLWIVFNLSYHNLLSCCFSQRVIYDQIWLVLDHWPSGYDAQVTLLSISWFGP